MKLYPFISKVHFNSLTFLFQPSLMIPIQPSAHPSNVSYFQLIKLILLILVPIMLKLLIAPILFYVFIPISLSNLVFPT